MVASHLSRSATAAAFACLMAACAGEPTAPRPLTATAAASASVREHIEFSDYNNYDYPISCVTGTTHWEGWVQVTIDIVTTASGMVSSRFNVAFDPGYFVEINGTRYYPVSFVVNEHHVDGNLTNIAGTAAGVFRSADGQTIPLGFHVQLVYDPQSNTVVDWKFTGACP